MSYRTARTPSTLLQEEREKFILIQWHNGTDSRQDALPDGGWEIERKTYPGLRLPLKTGTVLHSAGTMDAWIAEYLTMAILDHRMTWFIDDSSQASARNPRGAVEVAQYQPGAWSRLRVLAWCGEMDLPVVFTMRASISSDFMKGLKAFQNGALTVARQDNPDLPACAFWMTVSPGPREKRGKAGASSWITPPIFDLPAEDAQPVEIEQWLEEHFVGQDLIDRMAEQAPDLIQRFRSIGGATRSKQPVPAEPETDDNPAPDGARCAKGHIYDATRWFVCPVCHEEDERIKEELKRKVRALVADQADQNATRTAQSSSTSDEFDGLQRAADDPAIKAALEEAERKAAQRAPVMPVQPAPIETKEPTWQEMLETQARGRGLDPTDPRVKRVIDAAVKSKAPAAYQAAEKTIAAMRL